MAAWLTECIGLHSKILFLLPRGFALRVTSAQGNPQESEQAESELKSLLTGSGRKVWSGLADISGSHETPAHESPD